MNLAYMVDDENDTDNDGNDGMGRLDTDGDLGAVSDMDGDSALTAWDWSGVCDLADDLGDSETAWFSDSEDDDVLVCLDGIPDEASYRSARDLVQESSNVAFKHLPDPRKERKKALKQARLATVTEDDYDNPTERKLVRLMHLRAKVILNNQPDAKKWLDWFFCFTRDEFGLAFDECAISLGCDPCAVRQRFQKYFFLRWVVLNGPIAPLMAQPPEEWMSSASYYTGGTVGPALIRAAWEWPGITLDQLIEQGIRSGYSQKISEAGLAALLERKYLVDWQEVHCYAVGEQGHEIARSNPWR